MSTIRLAAILVCFISASVPALAGSGVQFYLQPLPPDAARLTFTIASVSAVAVDGTEYPLVLNLKTAGAGEAGRQRLLASGRIPAGRYAGLRILVTRAALKGARGDTALVVPDSPARTDFDWSVGADRTSLLWLTLRYQESVVENFRFAPVFSSAIPSTPVAEHLGFVSNAGESTITVFDKRLAQAVAIIDTCAGPSGLALDQRRRRLYAACPDDDEIQAIDVATGEIAQRVRSNPGDRPQELALTPDGATLISTAPGSNSVNFFDAMSLTRRERLDVGSGPGAIVVDPAGRRAFVFNTRANSISVVDVTGRTVAATLAVDAAPIRGQFNAGGTRLYVIYERHPYLTAFDPRTLNGVSRARLGTAVEAIAVDAVRGLVCLAGTGDTTIEFFDPNALMPLFSMKAGTAVNQLMIDPTDSRLYVVSRDARRVVVGGIADRRLISAIDVGARPYWVAVMGEK